MTLKHLRIFVTVYREMNITKAADLLHMTQPAVSRSIQELENYYGIDCLNVSIADFTGQKKAKKSM